ncbi:MAG: GAF domain-containing sensor histidine kinase [Campylobacterales bacterium]|nr:GAF domain-containing sensor histidine kinase [Campylobacterales bacterium]
MKNTTEIISILVKGMENISNANKPEEISTIAENFLSEMLCSEYVTLFVFDEDNKQFKSINDGKNVPVAIPSSLLARALESKSPVYFNHVKSEKHYDPNIDNPDDLKIKSQLIFPVKENEKLIGILRASRSVKQSQHYTNHEIALLKSIEQYLLQLVHILNNTETKLTPVNHSLIHSEIKHITKQTSSDNDDINDAMLFLANTVHDIRTPANSLYGFLELMEEYVNDPKLLQFLSGAKESAIFINTLTDSILDRVKYMHESSKSEINIISSVDFFSWIANIFTANMTDKKIHYTVSIDPNIPKEVQVDSLKLKRILINLIGNAYKFTPSDKIITFRVDYKKHNHSIMFTVKDEGIGIPKERQNEIFKAFKQAQEDTSIKFGGTGLGLAISAKYVQDLGGVLKLESKVDIGSTFYFDIPVDVIKEESYFSSFFTHNKKFVVYTNDPLSIDTFGITTTLQEFGIAQENISIGDRITKDTTHLICFENKLDDRIVSFCQENNITLLIFEEKMFSISKDKKYQSLKTITKNTYYAKELYDAIASTDQNSAIHIDHPKRSVSSVA